MVSRASPLPRLLSSQAPWFALFCVAFAPTVLWLLDRWTMDIYYNGHGIFVPFIVAWLVREHVRAEPITDEASSPWGFAFLGAGLAMLALDSAIRTQLLAATGFVLCLPGISLLLLGAGRTRKLAFPLLIAFFMLPVPAGFIQPVHDVLRLVSAWGSASLIDLYGIPVLRAGTTLHLPTAAVEVADACSGVSTLFASVLLGLILSYMARSWEKRALLMGAAVVLAVFCNTIRVTALTLIVHYYGVDPLRTALHEISGMITFAVVLAILFAMAGRTALRGAPA